MGSRGTASARGGNTAPVTRLPPASNAAAIQEPVASIQPQAERISKVELGRLRNSIYTEQAKNLAGKDAKPVSEVSVDALRNLNSARGQDFITDTLELKRHIQSRAFANSPAAEQQRIKDAYVNRRKAIRRIWNS
jgi:hypothetical protein